MRFFHCPHETTKIVFLLNGFIWWQCDRCLVLIELVYDGKGITHLIIDPDYFDDPALIDPDDERDLARRVGGFLKG